MSGVTVGAEVTRVQVTTPPQMLSMEFHQSVTVSLFHIKKLVKLEMLNKEI